ncbi:MAG TPA: tetratricopeptide repeat protein [Blastocatellia bacterium]|nr:tetratricopeptide repeat protein [Blastocatellia bacterium]
MKPLTTQMSDKLPACRSKAESIRSILRAIAACSLSVACIAAQTPSQSQSSSAGGIVIPPPKAGMPAVHAPDLKTLEADVREQLQSLQNSVVAASNDRRLTDEKRGEAYGSLGEAYHTYSLLPPAEECYRTAHQLSPEDFRWSYLLASILQADGRAEEAATYYKLALKQRPDYQPAAVNLGNIYLRQNRLDEARASFQEALKIDSNCAACRYGLGQSALSAKDYKQAAEYLEQALKETPQANRIHYALAMAYRGLGDLEKARMHLAQQGPVGVRVSDPLIDGLRQLIHGDRLHVIQGRKALDAGRYSEAAYEFRKAIAANPNGIPARVNLGAALAQMEDIAGAVEQYQQALKIDPANATAHYNVGFLLSKQNRHEQAIIHFQAVLALNPTDNESRLALAQELEKSRRADEALAEYSRIVNSDPANEDATLDLVKLLLSKRQHKRALETLEKAHTSSPEKGRTAILLAYLLAANPQYDLRDGARALDLARLVYGATDLVNHGAIVAMALAETGRCSEAAELQRRLIAAAERDRRPDIVVKLKTDLRRYESANPCRPQGELLVSDPAAQQERKQP